MSASDPVTYQKIAKLAGVSYVTVSRTFSGTAPVAAETRQRILQVAAELGYQPNYLARGLRGASTHSVGIIWRLAGSGSHAKVLQKLSQKIQHRDYTVTIIDHNLTPAGCAHALKELAGRAVDAVILDSQPTMINDPQVVNFLGLFKAAVVITRVKKDVPADLLVYDRYQAFRDVADHFFYTGRKHPFALLGYIDDEDHKGKVFLEQLQKRGLDATERNTLARYPVRFYLENAFDDIQKILQFSYERQNFDALVCSNDDVAVMAMNWLIAQGLRIPQDVAVVGSNNLAVCDFIEPPLASISREEDALIGTIDKMLFTRLADRNAPPMKECTSMKFIWRQSAG